MVIPVPSREQKQHKLWPSSVFLRFYVYLYVLKHLNLAKMHTEKQCIPFSWYQEGPRVCICNNLLVMPSALHNSQFEYQEFS